MRIYVTEFTRLVGKNLLVGTDLKPIVVRSSFGDDSSLSCKEFLLYLYSSLIPSIIDKVRFPFGLKEFKLTITFKF